MLVSGGKILAVDKIKKDDNVLSGDGVFTPLGPKIESPENKTYGYNPVEQTWVEAKSITTVSHDTTLSGDGADDALGINLAAATDENKIYGFKKDGSLSAIEASTYSVGYGLSADETGTAFAIDTDVVLTSADKEDSYTLADSNTVKVIKNDETKVITFSAKAGGANYDAGAYIDTTEFANNIIAVSGLQPSGNYLSAADKDEAYALSSSPSVKIITDDTAKIITFSAGTGTGAQYTAGAYIDTTKFAVGEIAVSGLQPAGNYLSADALNGYATETYANNAASAASAAAVADAVGKYQPIGDYLSANALAGYAKLTDVTSATSGKLNTSDFETWSATLDDTFQAKGNYLSSNALEGYAKLTDVTSATSGKLNTSDFETWSATLNDTYQAKGNYLSANALDTISGTWNEVSAISSISGYGYSAWSGISAVSAGPTDKLSAWFGETGLIISAAPSQNVLSAGDWISSTELADNKIAVSGLDTIISASNGIDAQWNAETSAWDISAVKPELAYARYSTNTATSTAGGTVTIAGYNEEERYSENVTLDGNAFVMQPGLYHIDVQAIIKVNTIDDNYKTVKLIWDSEPERSVEQEIDASYVHEETISLSFDVSVSSETSTTMRLENLPAGASYTICYLNVHEITNINSDLIGSTLDIVAGDGLTKNANTLNVNVGDGLKIENNKLKVAVGTGLKLEEGLVTGELNIAIDEETEEVVEVVQEIENDLAEKVTTTYSYANITDGVDITTQAASTSDGRMFGYLFSVPIKNDIYLHDDSNSETETVVGIYSQKDFGNNDYAIFGIYEYDPEYARADGTKGRTVPLCDTGRVSIKAGFNELPMKHGPEHDSQGQPETTLEFKSGCLYYATIFIPRGVVSGKDYRLACCPGYAATFHANPQLSVDQDNIPIRLSKADGSTETAEEAAAFDAVSFKDFGFGWRPKEDGSYETTLPYHEDYTQKRVFMQFRNKKK